MHNKHIIQDLEDKSGVIKPCHSKKCIPQARMSKYLAPSWWLRIFGVGSEPLRHGASLEEGSHWAEVLRFYRLVSLCPLAVLPMLPECWCRDHLPSLLPSCLPPLVDCVTLNCEPKQFHPPSSLLPVRYLVTTRKVTEHWACAAGALCRD